MKIHFFHTNDVHSHFEEYLQVASQLRRRREQVAECGETAFSFEIGDHADRKRMETEGTYGRTNAALIREMHYDAWTFGNNEGLTLPRAQWPELVNESQTPVLIANLFDDDSREAYPFFEPYVIFARDGVRVAVLGMTVPFFDFYKMYGVHVEHPRDTFARILPEIKRQDVDLVVLLSHLGLSSDRQIAEEIEGIDIILGGHTHQVLHEPEQVGRTIICQAGCYGRFFGHLTIDWDPQEKRVLSVAGGAIARDPNVTPDRDLSELLAHWQELAEASLTEPVAELTHELGHNLAGNSPLAHTLVDEMRRQTGADIAMINGGMFNHGLLAGTVTKADLLTCFPSPNITCIIELSGVQILSILRKTLDPAYVERVGFGYGFRGHFLGGMQVSGLQVQATRKSDSQFDVQAVWNGEPLSPERLYTVAATDYLYFSPVYEEFKAGRHVRFELPFLREMLARVLAGGTFPPADEERWTYQEA